MYTNFNFLEEKKITSFYFVDKNIKTIKVEINLEKFVEHNIDLTLDEVALVDFIKQFTGNITIHNYLNDNDYFSMDPYVDTTTKQLSPGEYRYYIVNLSTSDKIFQITDSITNKIQYSIFFVKSSSDDKYNLKRKILNTANFNFQKFQYARIYMTPLPNVFAIYFNNKTDLTVPVTFLTENNINRGTVTFSPHNGFLVVKEGGKYYLSTSIEPASYKIEFFITEETVYLDKTLYNYLISTNNGLTDLFEFGANRIYYIDINLK